MTSNNEVPHLRVPITCILFTDFSYRAFRVPKSEIESIILLTVVVNDLDIRYSVVDFNNRIKRNPSQIERFNNGITDNRVTMDTFRNRSSSRTLKVRARIRFGKQTPVF